VVTRLIHMMEELSSNLGRDTGNPRWYFVGFFRQSKKILDISSINTRPFPSKSFPSHYTCIIYYCTLYNPVTKIIHTDINGVTSQNVPDFITLNLSEYTTFLSKTRCAENRGSSVGTATRVGAGRPRSRSSILDRGKTFYFLRSVQTGSVTHPASYTMDTVRLFPPG
jgi:hypothetical protein